MCALSGNAVLEMTYTVTGATLSPTQSLTETDIILFN